jgi:hypothetical protein
MPEMELFGPEIRLLTPVPGIWRRLMFYMYWPQDEKARAAHAAKDYLRVLAMFDQKYGNDSDYYAAAHSITYTTFRKLGGWPALAAERGRRERNESVRALRTAAAVLAVVRRTPANEGSLNTAVHIIRATAKTYGLIGNRTDIRRAWKSHRSVAHLGIALFALFSGEFPERAEFADHRLLGQFIAVARDYQTFANFYVPPNYDSPLIAEDETWSFPANLQAAAAAAATASDAPMPPLSDDMLAALATYDLRTAKRQVGRVVRERAN